MNTIAEAQAWLRENMASGIHCPCCQQYVKIYRRTITNTMALALVMIAKHDRSLPQAAMDSDRWLDVPNYLSAMSVQMPQHTRVVTRGGDWAKLKLWGLIKPKELIRADGSDRAGIYRITDEGRQFVMGYRKVPKHALVYNQKLLKLDDTETISITDALGKKFNYEELMRG